MRSRLVKRVYSGSTGGTVGYLRMVYAGSQVAFETDSLANGTPSTIYTWGPGIDHLLGVKVGSTAYTVVTDPLGSVRALVRRSDGAWVGRLLYDPYGQLVDSAGPQPALRTRWTGREWDAETGFYFHRTRYYDPAVGRFVQEDQIGYAGGGNLYAYVNGDVLQARDADGLLMQWVDEGGFQPGCMGGSALMGDGSIVAGGCNGGGAGGRLAALGAWAAGAELDWLLQSVERGCRSRQCPSVESLVNNPELRRHFERVWRQSERSHREGMFYILMGAYGQLYISAVTWGEPNAGMILNAPDPPSTAIAIFHTHPSVGAMPGMQLSPDDVSNRAYWGIHTIVYDRNTIFYQSYDGRVDACQARNPSVTCR